MTFSEKMKELRKQTGKSQEQVSKEMGIAISTLRYYENGRLPDTYQLKIIKNYYNVTYEYLLDDECNNKSNETVEIGKKLKLSDTSLQKIIDLQGKNHSILGDPIEDRIAPKYFNIFLENLDLVSISYILYSLFDMQKIYINLNFFTSYSFFLNYFKQCINNDKISDLDYFFKFSDVKFDELKSLTIDTDLGSDNCIALISEDYIKIKNYIKDKDYESLECTIMDFNDTCIEILSKAFRQIKYFHYSLIEVFQDFLDIISKDIDFKDFHLYKFKEIEKYYKFMSNQEYLRKDFI